MLALVFTVKSGAGLAPLPVVAVGNEPDLVRLMGSAFLLTLHFYLVLHGDMRRPDASRANVLQFRQRGKQGVSPLS
jgi:hypothetical protein